MAEQFDAIARGLKELLDNPPPTIDGIRNGWDAVMERVLAGLAPIQGIVREPADCAGVAAEWYTSATATGGRVVLYLHGGGYVMGRVATHRDLIARIAVASRARVLAIDYALAPEHPFPAGIDDATRVYQWILDQGHASQDIAIVGDSAGGGLALATLARLVRSELPIPAAAVAISPWLEFEALGDSMQTNAASDLFNSRDTVLAVGQMYLSGRDPRDASPLYADLTNLPPLLLIAGGDEVLVDDARRFAAAARRHGVTVREEIYSGLYHDFPLFEPTGPAGEAAFAQIRDHLDTHLR